MITAQLFFKIAICLYGLSLGLSFISGKEYKLIRFILLSAIIVNAVAAGLRYSASWPMPPMYLSPVILPFCTGLLLIFIKYESKNIIFFRLILSLIFIVAAVTVCFPNDFYLPFLKSRTIWAHMFIWFGVMGKGCFLISAAWAIAGLLRNVEVKGNPARRNHLPRLTAFHNLCVPALQQPLHSSLKWTVWGFALWTFSMFSGELWSFLGWGTPVVWDDPAITTAMATWFFYVCLLHLHLSGFWTSKARGVYAAVGAVIVIVFNVLPDLGPFRNPF